MTLDPIAGRFRANRYAGGAVVVPARTGTVGCVPYDEMRRARPVTANRQRGSKVRIRHAAYWWPSDDWSAARYALRTGAGDQRYRETGVRVPVPVRIAIVAHQMMAQFNFRR